MTYMHSYVCNVCHVEYIKVIVTYLKYNDNRWVAEVTNIESKPVRTLNSNSV